MSEILSWNIDKEKLIDYRAEGWTKDFFASSPNNEYGVVVYNIQEWRMGAECGLIGIYSNSKNPIIELNSKRTWIWFDYEKTFYFLKESNCVLCRIIIQNKMTFEIEFPFVFINLKKKKFALFGFSDYTSIYYGLEEVEENKAKLVEVNSEELEYSKREKHTNKIVDLSKLKWNKLTDFDRASEKYYK